MVEPLPTVAYGAWPSPVTAASLVAGAAAVAEVRVDGDDLWWNEQRPSEGGRYQLVRRNRAGNRHDLFPPWDPEQPEGRWNARTAVMEYGGGAWGVRSGTVVFSDWADQRLYRVDPGSTPTPISPVPTTPRGDRWSEPTWLDERWLVCVRESHDPQVVATHGEATNELVALPVDGSAVEDPSLVRVLASGSDFVHAPVHHGDRLAWLRWDHPAMPWDATELVLATVVRDEGGNPVGTADAVVVAGGPAEAVSAPGFTDEGDLVWCADGTGWSLPWLLPVEAGTDVAAARPILAEPCEGVEFAGPLWVGGGRWWAQVDRDRFVFTVARGGALVLVEVTRDGALRSLPTPFTEVQQVVADGTGGAVVVAGTPVSEGGPYRLTLGEGEDPGDAAPTVGLELLRPGRDLGLDEGWLSAPRHVSFPSTDGRTAHALHYAPRNPTVRAPAEASPPLVVMIHGGPTSMARHRLDLAKQFWTSRGFAVADVNYGGSSGYGRAYRALLNGRWGIVDVEDAVAAAAHLASEGAVDPAGLAIRGGSAGGYTTLAALAFHDTFRAGASHYGVADLAALATDTHKFESRYLDGLVGPWPDARSVYDARSPIHHTEGFTVPLLVLQGSEDEVVPPNQAEMIVAAMAESGVPHAYLLFDGEQHGFRQAASIIRALEAELWFYGRVFGFEPADAIEPVAGAVGL